MWPQLQRDNMPPELAGWVRLEVSKADLQTKINLTELNDLVSYLTEASSMRFLNLTFLNLSLSFHTSSLLSVLAEKGASLLF